MDISVVFALIEVVCSAIVSDWLSFTLSQLFKSVSICSNLAFIFASSPFVTVNVVVFPFVYVIVYVSTNPDVPVFLILAIPFPVGPTGPVAPC